MKSGFGLLGKPCREGSHHSVRSGGVRGRGLGGEPWFSAITIAEPQCESLADHVLAR
ncbi:MAG: hypothetical protein ACR5LG_02145 [Sodalis sp. (in: enterobacteria)]|uniref:hypothetical protein n=1 Tax=Sodalis sp. (in: enterobacteria) TaxID=1898979 RepID=UPI003F31A374